MVTAKVGSRHSTTIELAQDTESACSRHTENHLDRLIRVGERIEQRRHLLAELHQPQKEIVIVRYRHMCPVLRDGILMIGFVARRVHDSQRTAKELAHEALGFIVFRTAS
ncbi:MAG: hypothetical protein HYR72_22425 [Deltaproteobacteria bacterium]|nr:hypothetical protein [Deltaproteobacteria bacterium]MBI3390605.1 hypothetical protein [Deltaproteobacteria bacterium]